MKRLLFLSLFGLPTLYAQPVDHQSADTPHIVIILVDDLGYADLSCYGSKDMRTPHIDALAKDGMMFTNFYANSAVCSPTRASLLSGCYPEAVGVRGVIRTNAENSWGYLDPNATLMPDALRRSGYHTALVGKWHLGLEAPNLPNLRGFDLFRGFLGDMMDDYYTHLRHDINYMRENDREVSAEGHATDVFTAWAVDYINERATEDQPFFLYLAYNAPHDPIQPPRNWVKRVMERQPGIAKPRAELVALIEHLDAGVGRVVQALKAHGIYERTMIIFSSDNGGRLDLGANNGPYRDGKASMYEGGLRVPTIVTYPRGVKAGSISDDVLLTMDIFPTVMEMLGASSPQGIDGSSFYPALTGESQQHSRPLFFSMRDGKPSMGGKPIDAARLGPYKLVQNNPFDSRELFDLLKDPGETTDIIADSARVAEKLANLLRSHMLKQGKVPWQRPDADAVRTYGQRDIYVSPTGNDQATGTREQPLASLAKARDIVRQWKADSQLADTVTVWLMDGEYYLDTSFVLTQEDSGSVQAPIRYRAENPGRAYVRGAIPVPCTAFKKAVDLAADEGVPADVRRYVRYIDLRDVVGTRKWPKITGTSPGTQLFYQGEQMPLARWPNYHYLPVVAVDSTKLIDEAGMKRGSKSGAFHYEGNRPSRWKNRADIWMYGYWYKDWHDAYVPVKAIDTLTRTVQLATPPAFGVVKDQRYYALNILEELDEPGEWYLDRQRGRLYWWPPGDCTADSVFLSYLTVPLVVLNGASHVTVQDLVVEMSVGDGMIIEGGQRINIEGCTIRHLGGHGVTVVEGRQHVISRNRINHVGRKGVQVAAGDRLTLQPAAHRIDSNHIHHYGTWLHCYEQAILLKGVGNRAAYNHIHDGFHSAIQFAGNDHIMEHNEIYRVLLETGEMGAFYTGRDWSARGNIIRHNYVHHAPGYVNSLGARGIHLDDCASGVLMYGNVFEGIGDAAVLIGGGRDNVVRENSFLDCGVGVHVDNRGKTWAGRLITAKNGSSWDLFAKLRQVKHDQSPYSQRYPALADILADDPLSASGNRIEGNLFRRGAWLRLRDGMDTASAHRLLITGNDVKEKTAVDSAYYPKGREMSRLQQLILTLHLPHRPEISGGGNHRVPVRLRIQHFGNRDEQREIGLFCTDKTGEIIWEDRFMVTLSAGEELLLNRAAFPKTGTPEFFVNAKMAGDRHTISVPYYLPPHRDVHF